MKKYDKFLTIALFIIEVFYFCLIKQLPKKAAKYPYFILGLLIILTISLAINTFLLKKNSNIEDENIFKDMQYAQFFKVIVLSAIYIFLIDIIGFFSITAIYLFVMMISLKSSFKWSLFSSIVFPIFLYLVFVSFLRVPIPKGILF